jgi:serine/threonine protein kinase HipA of HipAB toxin-antitoxin module
MQRNNEFFKLTRRQQVADEVSKLFNFRRQRLQHLILDEDLLPEERARLTLIETELTALENIVSDELYQLDEKLTIVTREIEEAKRLERRS